jgi:tetratricopeptide (TPR) repeat protein
MTAPACRAWLAIAVAACGGVHDPSEAADAPHVTTSGAIAIANLDHQIARLGDQAGVEDLLLVRSRFLGDHDALERASRLAEGRSATARELLRRARTRSAVHRFADALADLAAAERAGAADDEHVALRAAILIATGHADAAIPALEAGAVRRPGFAAWSTLATAYAAVGRLADADHMYLAALGALDTTSPFPYAWTYFVRGAMWAEHGGDPARGEALYAQALHHLPELVPAAVHLAELEAARGDLTSSVARLEPVAASSGEPEAIGLLGALHVRAGESVRGNGEIARARARYEALLARLPLAFADHATEFYLGPGADPERAWQLAQQNLAGRETDRALALAIDAARATRRDGDAAALGARARARSGRASARIDPPEPCVSCSP